MKLEGYKTYAFFGLMLVVWLANQFGFSGFELNAEQKEVFDLVILLGGFVLRKLTKGAPAF